MALDGRAAPTSGRAARGRCRPIECRPALLPRLAQRLRGQRAAWIESSRSGTETNASGSDQRVEWRRGRPRARRSPAVGRVIARAPSAPRRASSSAIGSATCTARSPRTTAPAVDPASRERRGTAAGAPPSGAGRSSATRSPSSRKSSMPARRIECSTPIAIPSGSTYYAAALRIGVGYGLPEQRRRSIGRAGVRAPRDRRGRMAGLGRTAQPSGASARCATPQIAAVATPRAVAAPLQLRPLTTTVLGPVGRGSQVPGDPILVAGGSERVRERAVRRRRRAGSTPSRTAARRARRELHHARPLLMMPARCRSSSARSVEFEPVEKLRERRQEAARPARRSTSAARLSAGSDRRSNVLTSRARAAPTGRRSSRGSAALPVAPRRACDRAPSGPAHFRATRTSRRPPPRSASSASRNESARPPSCRRVRRARARERRRIERAILSARAERPVATIESDSIRCGGARSHRWTRIDPAARSSTRSKQRFMLRGVDEEHEDAAANREPVASTAPGAAPPRSGPWSSRTAPTIPGGERFEQSADPAKARCRPSPWRPRTRRRGSRLLTHAAAASRFVFPIPASPRMINTEPLAAQGVGRYSVVDSAASRRPFPRGAARRDTCEVAARSVPEVLRRPDIEILLGSCSRCVGSFL